MNMGTVCILIALTVIHVTTASIVNVAQGKPASMSSSKSGYTASTAVDGKTGGYGPGHIIDTVTRNDFAWWKVDLEREVQNATVRIYFRTDYMKRRNGLKLYTSKSSFSSYPEGQLCHTVTGDPSGSDIPDVYNVTCPGRWRYLLLYTDTDNDKLGAVLDFGEVEVYACSGGTYGEDCTKICNSRKCVTIPTTCERDGRCHNGCRPGWTGADCTQTCDTGFYGPGCSLLCTDRNCVEPSTECDHVTGHCRYGCQPGYKEIDCIEKCESGTYGNCSLSCTDRNCLVQPADCNRVTGQCEGGCQAGYQGIHCRQGCDLGVNYGVNCIKSCTDRHCNQPSECDTRTGQCIGGCQVGWRGVDCTSQCPTGTFGSDCTSCTTRHCQGQSDCPADGTCSQGCQDGWTGIMCLEECSRGMYGPGCSITCGNCSSDYACHHVTGNCPSGCKAGWRTEKCNKVCSEDTYGPGCTQKCGKCDGGCDSLDGRCPAGCLDGYCGIKCDLALTGATDGYGKYLASLVGAVVGTFLVVVLLAVGIHIYLIRQGRLHWIKTSEVKQSVQESRDLTQMGSIDLRPADVSEHAQPVNQVHNNDYAVLDTGEMQGNKDYDVIQPKYYQNL